MSPPAPLSRGVLSGHRISTTKPNHSRSPALSQSRSTASGVITPHGKQGYSLRDSASAGLKLANNIAFGSNTFHFANSSSKLDKTANALGHIRTAGGVLHTLALYAAKVPYVLGSAVSKGSGFIKSLHSLAGISIATEGLGFFKDAATGGWRALRDIRAHKKRGEAQELLKQWDPETRTFQGSREDEQRLKELTGSETTDLTQSRKKTALSRLNDLKDLAIRGLGISSTALLIAEHTSAAAAKAVPGVAVAAGSIAAIQSGIKTGIQVAALNNLTCAQQKTDDALLQALSSHIKKERTILARKGLIQTGVNTVSTGAAIMLAASAVGTPAALVTAGALGTATAVGTMAFDGLHNRKLAKAREKAAELMSLGHPLQSLAKDNIGVAERAFLMRLRTSQGEELKSAVSFLRELGVTDNTIKKLQLAPQGVALNALQQTLYKDKLKFKGLMLKKTGKTLLHISGLSALGSKIKAGSQWLAGKLSALRETHTGYSLRHAPEISSSYELKPLAHNPDSTVFTRYRTRRHS
ncbi:hypothetical protein [Parendozoicomonas haliclonae]|uniref:Uncharacterized protein n=1 Tax=Parendozoicomonas haliclonae TaxID=1960125 RepID=A0A1X7ANE0_9GAMM|nr:hypothetical protein [Parendozoicomonas haliclonae]SMA49806.1 hypothetical protein EHSB41UT_03595 [Parendozoicomonas haliclonae]